MKCSILVSVFIWNKSIFIIHLLEMRNRKEPKTKKFKWKTVCYFEKYDVNFSFSSGFAF